MPKQTKDPKDTYLYCLKKGNKIVYIGITNDPERRADEHRGEEKDFDKLVLIYSSPMTRSDARQKEAEALAIYRRNHGGCNPRYNQDQDG